MTFRMNSTELDILYDAVGKIREILDVYCGGVENYEARSLINHELVKIYHTGFGENAWVKEAMEELRFYYQLYYMNNGGHQVSGGLRQIELDIVKYLDAIWDRANYME